MRNQDDEWVQPLFKIFTNDNERSLGDLFIRHPRFPELLKHAGRVHDLLNFWSEKFHPTAFENRIAEHPDADECMMIGTMRRAASLVVRLREGGDWSGCGTR